MKREEKLASATPGGPPSWRDRSGVVDLGVGVGLRVPHYSHIIGQRPRVDFFEIISENFMVEGGRPRYHLGRVLETYRVVAHGVSLNIGGPGELDRAYLTRLKRLLDEARVPWVSDHFCWCGGAGAHLHDLLPMPYTPEAVARLVERARMVQDLLERPFLLENTSSYMTYKGSTLSEWEFIGEVAERADIGLLFDVNNVYVSAYNHGFDPIEFVKSVPHQRVSQIHLASHTNQGRYIIDTHRGHVIEPVWDLYRLTIELCGSVSTLIEWDDEIPAFPTLAAEAERARTERARALSARAAGSSSVHEATIRAALREGAPPSADARPGWVQGGPRESLAEASVG
ncbi:MAG: DUF692 domain-containing protein [Polyangiaceae bacterium]